MRLRLAEYKTHIVNAVHLSKDTPKRSAARCLTPPSKKLLTALAGLDTFELIDPTTVCQGIAVSFMRPMEVRFGALTTTQSLGTCLPAFSTATALQRLRTPNYRCCLIDYPLVGPYLHDCGKAAMESLWFSNTARRFPALAESPDAHSASCSSGRTHEASK